MQAIKSPVNGSQSPCFTGDFFCENKSLHLQKICQSEFMTDTKQNIEKERNVLLNKVADLVNLDPKIQENRNIIRSLVIKGLMDQGMEFVAAFDFVWGENAYKKFADEVYNSLKEAV